MVQLLSHELDFEYGINAAPLVFMCAARLYCTDKFPNICRLNNRTMEY